ncbi:MAG: LLM class F420-dependent oxidoreductase [Acidimicrobiales bacterium]|nr:MAG: LLM class F420-dependent oxidoreductase [Acidimicrobiales bacterium]
MRLGITIPFEAPLAEHGAIFLALRDAGYTDLWTAETARTDAFGPLMAAALVAPELHLGSAIASVFSRGPALLAMNAASLAEAAPGRVTIGIGASSKAMSAGWNDRPYENPLHRVTDSVSFLRATLSGERVASEYRTFEVDRFALERPPAAMPSLAVAALGPAMLSAAARCADGVVLNWLGADDVALVRAHLEQQRPGADLDLITRIFVCPSSDAATVRSSAKPLLARYLTVPAYAASQRWMGRGELLAPMWDAWNDRDRAAATSAVPDDVVDHLVVHGTPSACAEQVHRYVEQGVTVPVVKILPLADIEPLSAAVAVATAYGELGG